MKLRINGPVTVIISACGLLLAIAAWRAWELNDDINGMLMASLGKIFSVLPKPSAAESASFRADSILSPTEVRLIFAFRFLAVAFSLIAIASALLARARGKVSAFHAIAALISFGTCMVVHNLVGIIVGAATLILVAIIDGIRKRRYNSSLNRDGDSAAAL